MQFLEQRDQEASKGQKQAEPKDTLLCPGWEFSPGFPGQKSGVRSLPLMSIKSFDEKKVTYLFL